MATQRIRECQCGKEQDATELAQDICTTHAIEQSGGCSVWTFGDRQWCARVANACHSFAVSPRWGVKRIDDGATAGEPRVCAVVEVWTLLREVVAVGRTGGHAVRSSLHGSAVARARMDLLRRTPWLRTSRTRGLLGHSAHERFRISGVWGTHAF